VELTCPQLTAAAAGGWGEYSTVGDVLAEKGTRARDDGCIGDSLMQSTAGTMQNADQSKGFGRVTRFTYSVCDVARTDAYHTGPSRSRLLSISGCYLIRSGQSLTFTAAAAVDQGALLLL